MGAFIKRCGRLLRHLMKFIYSFIISMCLLCCRFSLFGAGPPNVPAQLDIDLDSSTLSLHYFERTLFYGHLFVKTAEGEYTPDQFNIPVRRGISGQPGIWISSVQDTCSKVDQRIRIIFNSQKAARLVLKGEVKTSKQGFPAETKSMAQTRFPMVRNTVGLSRNLRNNAVYDRKWDWVLIGPGDGDTRIMPVDSTAEDFVFSFDVSDDNFELIFRPRFYQKFKNLPFFEPWTFDVWEKSVSGWCSWWPYRAGFNQQDMEKILRVLAEKNLDDFGYRYIQIDHSPHQPPGGTPESWLDWNEKWPAGMKGTAELIKSCGFSPAVWVHARFRDQDFVLQHPQLFVPGETGDPLEARYLGYVLDVTGPETVENLVRPTYRGFRQAGFDYVKVDGLRHLMYDGYNHAVEYLSHRNYTPGEGVRRYVEIAREELGDNIYMLACWGVLPEVIGAVDGCRLGGDGYGWSTLHYFNSWNGVVWRNDPDHCDILPEKQGKFLGVIGGKHRTHYASVEADIRDTIIRPAFASFAGSVLMLSDKAEVYQNDRYLRGVKRSGPVLFTVPGQLYDFYPEKSSLFVTHDRTVVKTGQGPRLTDAPRWHGNCPFWMLEIEKPFENWNVLARFNWNSYELPAMEVQFADLGLSGDDSYLVYEFWDDRFVGVFEKNFPVVQTGPRGVQMYAIRKKQPRPQIVSTSRHISQGGVDLTGVVWDDKKLLLKGTSKVVQNDPYSLIVYVPDGFEMLTAASDAAGPEISRDGNLLSLTSMPAATGLIDWIVEFQKD